MEVGFSRFCLPYVEAIYEINEACINDFQH